MKKKWQIVHSKNELLFILFGYDPDYDGTIYSWLGMD